MGDVREKPARECPGLVRAFEAGSVPSEACAPGVHRQSRWESPPFGRSHGGGQGRPTRNVGGARSSLRAGFSWFLLWVSAEKESARCIGRPVGCDHEEEGERGARRRHSWVLRRPQSRMAGEVCRAPHFRPARHSADPQVAQGWRAGGWRTHGAGKGSGSRRKH